MRWLYTRKVFILLFLIPYVSHSQYWMQRGGGVAIDEALAVTNDANNNTYTTGYFTFTATFDGNTISSSGLEDIFIAKTNASGSIAWLKRAGGNNIDRALAIAADDSGNAVVAGYFFSSATFDAQTITSAGQRDIFIAKYNSSGNLLWVTRAGGADADAANALNTDENGDIIITGEFTGSCNFGTTTLVSMNNSIDVFTAKYSSSGNFLWAKQGAGYYTDRGTGIAADSLNNIYVTGTFSDTITFDQPHYNSVFSSVFIIKYDSLGQEQWFRWMGSPSVADAGGISILGNDVNLTGSFNNDLYFYGGSGNPSLIGSYVNNVFVCRYNLSGNLIWKRSDGSSGSVTSKAIATSPNGELTIAGNFKCRFSDFSTHYGSGTFCSLGFWDTYVASYDNNGNWMWARNYGGHEDDIVSGITIAPNNNITTVGSFSEHYFSTFEPNAFTLNGANTIDYGLSGANSTYCNDSAYTSFIYLYSYGNKDVFINSNINLNRQPYDYFKRSGVTCNRPFNEACIQEYPFGAPCRDTITVCGGAGLFANMSNYYDPTVPIQITPLYHFIWSTGDTIQFAGFNNMGYVNVSVSTYDGCFANTDSVYIVNNPPAIDPAITDSKGININATGPSDIPFCATPDSVTLTCTNAGTNTLQWSGFAPGQNPVTVYNPGSYSCTLSNSFGCAATAIVNVVTGSPFPPIVPEMICLNDTDFNDTIEVCEGSTFFMYMFDTLTNPGPLTDTTCIPGMLSASWSTSFDTNVQYNGVSSCPIGAKEGFKCMVVDSFFINVSAVIYRENACYRDSFVVNKQIYVIVHPTPTGTVTFTVTGPQYMCPGTPTTLVASPPGYTYSWSNGGTGDSTAVTVPGMYGAVGAQLLTNSFGCSNVITAYHAINIQAYPIPYIDMAPINGVICPGDSVYLMPSGTGTVLSWQGPNGSFGINEQSVFVTTPGTYYYIMEIVPGCSYVSSSVQLINYSSPTIITTPGTSLCQGDSITLQIISDPLGSIIQWDPPFNDNAFSHVVDTPGTYTCQVEQCYIITPFSVTITQDSAVAIIYTSSTTNTICGNDSILLSSNGGMATYEWLPQGIFADSIYVDQTGTYTLLTTSIGGCSDSAQVSITVVPNTLTPPSITDTTICSGYPVLLNALSADSVYWSTIATYAGWFATGNFYQTPPLQTPVTYYLFTQSGVCRSTIDSVTVGISMDTGVAIIYSSVPTNTVCSGDSILLSANTGMATYQWLPQGFFADSIYVSQSGNYSLIAISSFGCSDTASIAVSVVPNTLTPPLINDSTICPGNTVLLNAVSSDSVYWSATTSYTGWFNAGNFYQTPFLQNAVTYYLFTQSGTCRSTIDSVAVAISNDTAVAIIFDAAGVTFCNGDSLLLSANAGMMVYEWQPINVFSDSVYITQSGNYTLITSSTFGCKDTAFIAITEVPNTLSPPLLTDATACKGDSVVLNTVSADPVFWSSTPSYSTVVFSGSSYIIPSLQSAVTYYLFTSDGLCKSSFDSVHVSIFEDCDTTSETPDIFLPNVFTPNGDGVNDFFPGQHGNFSIDLKIYNRWGTLVYDKQNLTRGWDGYFNKGEKANDGTYYGLAVFNFKDGSSKKIEGSFLLIGN